MTSTPCAVRTDGMIRTDEVIVDVKEGEASVVPNDTPTDVATEMPAMDRVDDQEPVAGFAPSKEQRVKTAKTNKKKKAEREKNEAPRPRPRPPANRRARIT